MTSQTAGSVTIPHLAVPFTIGPTGAAQTLQQGSLAEVTQCVATLAGTRPGTRLMVPSYGTTDPAFGGLDVTAFTQAAGKWEPRAAVAVQSTPGDPQQVVVQVAIAGGTP